jgi:hypothetical protein
MANLATAINTPFTATGAFMFRSQGGRVLLKMKAGAGDADSNYVTVGEVLGDAKLCTNDLAGMVYKLVPAEDSFTSAITVLAWQ